MLQILAMMFFLIGAIAAIAAMLGAVVEHWERVTQALGLDRGKTPLPRPVPVRVRPVRTAARTALRPTLRAAA